MKKIIALFLTLCCCASLFAGRGQTTPHGWYDDYAAALARARRENKPMLLLFTGSDWCGFCIRLRRTVLDKPEFRSFAYRHLVLVYIDSPRRVRLPRGLVAQNRMLREKFGAGGGVPNTLVVTPDERIIGRIGGCPRNPHDYLRRLREILRNAAQRD